MVHVPVTGMSGHPALCPSDSDGRSIVFHARRVPAKLAAC